MALHSWTKLYYVAERDFARSRNRNFGKWYGVRRRISACQICQDANLRRPHRCSRHASWTGRQIAPSVTRAAVLRDPAAGYSTSQFAVIQAVSLISVNCLPCRSFRSMPSRRPAPRLRRALSPRSQKQSIHALAAAATCASSRPSCAGNSRNTNPRQFRQRSGSTPHDDGTDP